MYQIGQGPELSVLAESFFKGKVKIEDKQTWRYRDGDHVISSVLNRVKYESACLFISLMIVYGSI